VQAFEPVQVIYLSNENATSPGYIRQAVDAAILRVNGAVVASRVGTDVADSIESVQFDDDSRAEFAQALYDRATAIWEDNPIGVTVELTAGEDDSESSSNFQTGLRQSVPGMGSLFVMFTVLGGMTALIQERNQWTLQRLAVMPISRAQILAGKILGRFLLGILQFLVVFAVGLLLGVNLGNDLLSLVLIVLAYTLTITAFSFALGTRLQNESQAAGFSLLLSMVLASLGGAMWPLEVVPEIMQIVGHVSPVAWAMDSFNTLLFFGGGLGDILLPVGVLLAMTVVLFALAVWRFEYE
jgi:ABC-type transport system involved in multi-copper enzyme maturation permease subunit